MFVMAMRCVASRRLQHVAAPLLTAVACEARVHTCIPRFCGISSNAPHLSKAWWCSHAKGVLRLAGVPLIMAPRAACGLVATASSSVTRKRVLSMVEQHNGGASLRDVFAHTKGCCGTAAAPTKTSLSRPCRGGAHTMLLLWCSLRAPESSSSEPWGAQIAAFRRLAAYRLAA